MLRHIILKISLLFISSTFIVHGAPTSLYSFNYETPDSSRSELADNNLEITGHYKFTSPDGVRRTLFYTAGKNGFQAKGDFLPKSPEDSIVKNIADQTPVEPLLKGQQQIIQRGNPNNFHQSLDGAYEFMYEAPESSRFEVSDSSKNVNGIYRFFDDSNVERIVNYRAGKDIGFIAEADFLPKAPVVPLLKVTAVHKNPINEDGSYAFSYSSGSQSRSESADADLNVIGSYKYIDDKGIERVVNYKAGKDTGFVPEADFFPKNVPLKKSVLASDSPNEKGNEDNEEEEAITFQKSSNGNYKFEYKTPESSRFESSDSNMNIKGSYKFIDENGIERSVTYRAGKDIGFVPEADFFPKPVPVAPLLKATAIHKNPINEDGSYDFSYSSDLLSRSESADAENNVQGTYSFIDGSGKKQTIVYKAGKETGFNVESDILPQVPVVQNQAFPAYAFSYDNSFSLRDESADENLNVKGHYSFFDPEGEKRTVYYTAGPNTGFVAKGEHLPQQ